MEGWSESKIEVTYSLKTENKEYWELRAWKWEIEGESRGRKNSLEKRQKGTKRIQNRRVLVRRKNNVDDTF